MPTEYRNWPTLGIGQDLPHLRRATAEASEKVRGTRTVSCKRARRSVTWEFYELNIGYIYK